MEEKPMPVGSMPVRLSRTISPRAKPRLAIIGVGAFGALAAKHLAPHVELLLHDTQRDPHDLALALGAQSCDLATAAQADVLVLAVPVQRLEAVLRQLAPLLRAGTLVIDVASVKLKPVAWMQALLPDTVAIIGTHPLFGPQSGKDGIAGLNLVLCPVRGGMEGVVRRFCRDRLQLRVLMATADDHDRDMAYVQGLTHLLSKVVVRLGRSPPRLTTRTYQLLAQMVEMVRHDSDDLFRAIARENPHVAATRDAFFAAAAALEKDLEALPEEKSG